MNRQFLTFTLNNSLYAVEVTKVQEVLNYVEPVKLPCTSSFVEGIINSRGEGISAINLRKRLGMEKSEVTKNTRIIVLEISHPKKENDESENIQIFGAVADSVEEVIELDESLIDPAPKFGNSIPEEYISGIGKKDDGFIIILNVDKIFTEKMMQGIAAIA
ncbi:MAG: chemotaxis protein CheW [Treponema sp.]|nr:chemotaxis protein CheW [Treponema sp.]